MVLDKALGLLEYSGRIWGAIFEIESKGHQQADDVPSSIIKSCRHATHNIPIPEGINAYKLYLDIPYTRVVGVGKVYNLLDVMLHNARIPPNHMKVSIDVAIDDNSLLPFCPD
ncbi:hypothetical protein Lal_00039160 [Lupinus albus]|nr:hypothetical protein Lal_00039160 [Lupinus albus]